MPTRRAITLPLVTPIVPVLRDQPFDDPAYLFEPKYDGFRGLLYLSGRECRFRSKRGNVLKVEERARHLFEAAQRIDLEGIVAKRKADPYTPETVWYTVKNRAYTQMEGRWELFEAALT
jgi:ATP-dependent DNA ligase